MNTTTTITRELLKALRTDMDAALATVAAKHGVAINVGNATFSANAANFKLLVAAKGDGTPPGESAADLKAASDFRALATLYSLKPEWLGTAFRRHDGEWKIKGLLPKRQKYPVLAVNTTTGKRILFPVETVKLHLGG